MSQGNVNSSINIKDLSSSFTFHVKCGEIYYLQPLNEVLIICNICNNENFDKYDNFLQHFRVCYKKSQKKDLDVNDFVNGGTHFNLLQKGIDFMDIIPPQLSESDDDDDEENVHIELDATETVKLIPTIEINDSDSDTEKQSLKNLIKTASIIETNKININNVQKEIGNHVKAKTDNEKKSEIEIQVQSTPEDIEMPISPTRNERPKKKKKKSVQFSDILVENIEEKIPEKKQNVSVEKQSTSKIDVETLKKPTEINHSKETENKEQLLDQVSPSVDPNAILSGLLPHIAAFGDYPVQLFSNISNTSNVKFKNPKYLKSEQRPHQCPECGKCFAQRINLVTHFRTHTGEKPYKCTMCDNAYPQKSNLDAHMLKHTGIRPYGCEDCGKRFYQLSHLLAHERVHSGERPFACSECDRCFSQSSHLSSHKRNTHSGEQLYYCSLCPSQFFNQNDLNKHQLTHINEKLLEMKDFGMSSGTGDKNSTNNLLNNFNDILNEQIYLTKNSNTINIEKIIKMSELVNIGNKSNGVLLQAHQQIQKQQQELQQQELQQQQLQLERQQQLQQEQQQQKQLEYEALQQDQKQSQEITIKDEELQQLNSKNSPSKDNNEEQIKRFECQLCDKKFYQSNHLAMHQRTHSVQKIKSESPTKLKFKFKPNAIGTKRRHECDDCGKKFALVTELKVHQRRKH